MAARVVTPRNFPRLTVRQGKARQGKARQGKARQYMPQTHARPEPVPPPSAQRHTRLPMPRVCGSSVRVTDQPQHALVQLQKQIRREERANNALVEDIAALTVVLGFD